MDSVTLVGNFWQKAEVLRTSAPHKQADEKFLLSPVGDRRLTAPYVYLLFVCIYMLLHPHQNQKRVCLYTY